ncbi:MAG: hypothetical protein ACAI38_02720 [Myxococcota bacterium]
MRKRLFWVIALGCFGTACAGAGTESTARRFDKRLYAKAQEPELAELDPALQKCAGDEGPLKVTWQVAGDGHIEDVKIIEPKGYSEKLESCVRAAAYTAQFTAPANRKPAVVSRDVGNTVVAGDAEL